MAHSSDTAEEEANVDISVSIKETVHLIEVHKCVENGPIKENAVDFSNTLKWL